MDQDKSKTSPNEKISVNKEIYKKRAVHVRTIIVEINNKKDLAGNYKEEIYEENEEKNYSIRTTDGETFLKGNEEKFQINNRKNDENKRKKLLGHKIKKEFSDLENNKINLIAISNHLFASVYILGNFVLKFIDFERIPKRIKYNEPKALEKIQEQEPIWGTQKNGEYFFLSPMIRIEPKIYETNDIKGVLILLEKGDSLRNMIKEANKNASKIPEVKNIAMNLLEALFLLHNIKVIHNDIKSSNIICVGSIGGVHHYKFIDYGIALIVKFKEFKFNKRFFNLTDSFSVMGTLDYASPIMKAALLGSKYTVVHDPFKSDLYSLGIVFLEILLTNSNRYEQFLENKTDTKNFEKLIKENPLLVQVQNKEINILEYILAINENDRMNIFQLMILIENPILNPKHFSSPYGSGRRKTFFFEEGKNNKAKQRFYYNRQFYFEGAFYNGTFEGFGMFVFFGQIIKEGFWRDFQLLKKARKTTTELSLDTKANKEEQREKWKKVKFIEYQSPYSNPYFDNLSIITKGDKKIITQIGNYKDEDEAVAIFLNEILSKGKPIINLSGIKNFEERFGFYNNLKGAPTFKYIFPPSKSENLLFGDLKVYANSVISLDINLDNQIYTIEQYFEVISNLALVELTLRNSRYYELKTKERRFLLKNLKNLKFLSVVCPFKILCSIDLPKIKKLKILSDVEKIESDIKDLEVFQGQHLPMLKVLSLKVSTDLPIRIIPILNKAENLKKLTLRLIESPPIDIWASLSLTDQLISIDFYKSQINIQFLRDLFSKFKPGHLFTKLSFNKCSGISFSDLMDDVLGSPGKSFEIRKLGLIKINNSAAMLSKLKNNTVFKSLISLSLKEDPIVESQLENIVAIANEEISFPLLTKIKTSRKLSEEICKYYRLNRRVFINGQLPLLNFYKPSEEL